MGGKRPDGDRDEDNASVNAGRFASFADDIYLNGVAEEALKRGGKCSQLKGHAQEILYRDKLNASAECVLGRAKHKLSKSKTGVGADIVKVKPGRKGQCGQWQVKDATSKPGARQITKKVNGGQYRNQKLVGSPETVQACKASGMNKKTIESTGISSSRSTRAAKRAGVKLRDKQADLLVAKDVCKSAAKSALMAAAFQTATTVYWGVKQGRKPKAIAKDVLSSSGGAALETGVKNAVSFGLREGAVKLVASSAREGLKKFVRSNAATAIAFSSVEIACETIELARGKVSVSEFFQSASVNIGGTGGALGGAAAGSLVCPFLGTVIGGVVGGLAGTKVGKGVGRAILSAFRWGR